MSDETTLNPTVLRRIDAFWNHLPYYSGNNSTTALGAVFLLCFCRDFLRERDYVLDPRGRLDHVLDIEIPRYIGKSRQHQQAGEAYMSLRAEVSNDSLRKLCSHLLDLVKSLNGEEFSQVAGLILDEIPERYPRDMGEFRVPKQVAEFMVEATLSPSRTPADMFSPFVPNPAIGEFIGGGKSMAYCEVPRATDATCMAVHQLASGCRGEINVVDSEVSWNSFGRPFERIVAAPPFGKKLNSRWSQLPDTEAYCVEQVADMLRHKGRAAICVSPSFLFRNTPSVVHLRRNLVEMGWLECVILLPSKIYKFTSIQPVLLLLDGGRLPQSRIRVIDASDCVLPGGRPSCLDADALRQRLISDSPEMVREVTPDELRDVAYDLTPSRHLAPPLPSPPPEHVPADFSSLVIQLMRVTPKPDDKGIYLRRLPLFGLSDGLEINFEGLGGMLFKDMDRDRALKKIHKDCLLVDTMLAGKELRAVWFRHSGKDLFVGPEILAFEPRSAEFDGRWIALALRSGIVTTQVRSLAVGVMRSRIRPDLLGSIRLFVPPISQQRALVQSAAELQAKARTKERGLETDLSDQREEFLKDVRLKKHSLSQVVNDIKSRVDFVATLLDRNGQIGRDDIIGIAEPVPAFEYLNGIASRCGALGDLLESLTQTHVFRPLRTLELERAFEDLRSACRGRDFKMEVAIEDQTFVDPFTNDPLKPCIRVDPKDFADLCENIIENAIRHGFHAKQAERLVQVHAILHAEAQLVELSFKNNGRPLPEGITTERFVIRGEKAGPMANTGTGGYHIKALMDHAGGKVSIHNLTEELFTVEVKLFFPFEQ